MAAIHKKMPQAKRRKNAVPAPEGAMNLLDNREGTA
jgi:hypothetical protein